MYFSTSFIILFKPPLRSSTARSSAWFIIFMTVWTIPATYINSETPSIHLCIHKKKNCLLENFSFLLLNRRQINCRVVFCHGTLGIYRGFVRLSEIVCHLNWSNSACFYQEFNKILYDFYLNHNRHQKHPPD